MTRMRAFDFPHKALRNVLSKFTFLAGTIDHSNPPEIETLRKMGNEMFDLLENHVHHENNHTFQHIEKKRPGACEFELEDHERVEKIQNALKSKLNGEIGNGHDFYLAACKFQSIYLEHLN